MDFKYTPILKGYYKNGDAYYAYKGILMPMSYVLKCEEDDKYFRAMTGEGIKKITRADLYFDKYIIEDKIRLVYKLDNTYILEGYEFIGCDEEPYLEITFDSSGFYKIK